jgi:hypothetical protein
MILDTFQSTEACEKDSSRFWLLLQPLEELLRTLYHNDFSNPGHLLYDLEFRWAEQQRTGIRSLYIARICRALGLLGYNIHVEPFKVNILRIFRSLLESDHHGFSTLYGRYIYAEDFHDIVNATRRSMQGSSLDEMVQLLQSDRIQSPLHEIFGLRLITYSMTEEIPSLLADLPSQDPTRSQMPLFEVSSADSLMGVNAELEEENVKDDHVDALNEVNEILSDQEEEDPDFIPRTDLPEVIHARYSEDETQATTVIQRAYRKVLEQRRSRNKTGLEGQNRYYFHLCWNKVREENRKRDKYTQAFLGPLPLLLSSLDSAEILTMARKRQMKKCLRGSILKHESLDKVSSVLNRIPTLLKNIKECRKKLLPSADWHREHDLDLLKKHVSDAVNLLSDSYLPFEATDDLRNSIELVRTALLKEKVKEELPKTCKKDKRPELRMDDDENDLSDWERDAEDEEQ